MRNWILILVMIVMAACSGSSNKADESGKADDTPMKSDEMLHAESIEVKEYVVVGMTCTGCENTVKKKVKELNGIAEVSASHVNQNAIVKYDAANVSPEEIMEKIIEAGYEVAEFHDYQE